jgi:hypothetical protein
MSGISFSIFSLDLGLGNGWHRNQFRAAPGILEGMGGVFRRKSPHHQRQLPVGRHLDRSPINPLHVLGGTNTAVIYLHNKFGVFHGLLQFPFLRGEIQLTSQRTLRLC